MLSACMCEALRWPAVIRMAFQFYLNACREGIWYGNAGCIGLTRVRIVERRYNANRAALVQSRLKAMERMHTLEEIIEDPKARATARGA